MKTAPGKTVYTLDEYHQRVIRSEVNAQGYLQNSRVFADGGDRSVVTDSKGNLYVTNGEISIFSPTGKLIGTIETPERPTSLLMAGDKLYFTAVNSLYQVNIRDLLNTSSACPERMIRFSVLLVARLLDTC